jgi:CRP-like cAMP-binding protein
MNTKLQNPMNAPDPDLNISTAMPLNPAITNSRFLSGLEPEALAQILAAAERRIVLSKELIITAGERAERLFLVVRGNARYYRLTKTGDEVLLQWLTPSYVFGLGTLLKDPLGYLGNAQALSDCELLIWRHTVLRQLAVEHPQLSENALAIVLQYLRNYSNRHLNLSSRTAGQRLAEALLNLAQQAGEVHSKGIEVQTTNEQLSSFADVSPFTASRLLNVWERKGTVSKRRGKVVIHSPEDLVMD